MRNVHKAVTYRSKHFLYQLFVCLLKLQFLPLSARSRIRMAIVIRVQHLEQISAALKMGEKINRKFRHNIIIANKISVGKYKDETK